MCCLFLFSDSNKTIFKLIVVKTCRPTTRTNYTYCFMSNQKVKLKLNHHVTVNGKLYCDEIDVLKIADPNYFTLE